MGLSGIFDPLVQSWFRSRYANSGGGSGDTGGGATTLNTGICASTPNTLVLELKPSVLNGLEICEVDGYESYKLSEDGSYANRVPEWTTFYLCLFDGSQSYMGFYQVNPLGNWLPLADGIDVSGCVYTFAHTAGALLIQYENPLSGNAYTIYVLGTEEAAATYGAPTPGVYVEKGAWDEGYSDRIILSKSIME